MNKPAIVIMGLLVGLVVFLLAHNYYLKRVNNDNETKIQELKENIQDMKRVQVCLLNSITALTRHK